MKIIDVECLIVDKLYPYVVIQTDEGITGFGECFRRAPFVTKAAIETVYKDILIGIDPLEISNIWHKLFNASSVAGPYGSLLTAVSGIDTALWDIKLKEKKSSLSEEFGGKKKNFVNLYASSMRRDMEPIEEAERAQYFYEMGFKYYKMHSAFPEEIDSPYDNTLKTVSAIRKLLGNKIEIMVDVNGAYSLNKAIEVGKELQNFDVFQFEQPVHVTMLDEMKIIQEELEINISSGECCYTVPDFLELIEKSSPDIIQPDAIKTGGITEFNKIVSELISRNQTIMIHNTQPLISTSIHMNFLSANPDLKLPLEYNIEPNSLLNNPIVEENFNIVNGQIEIPDKVSYGLDFNLDEMKKRCN
tara:strand:- start:214 stop:1290 length:1077 start_codon:yes stop_codon:yes gene_type:complete